VEHLVLVHGLRGVEQRRPASGKFGVITKGGGAEAACAAPDRNRARAGGGPDVATMTGSNTTFRLIVALKAGCDGRDDGGCPEHADLDRVDGEVGEHRRSIWAGEEGGGTS